MHVYMYIQTFVCLHTDTTRHTYTDAYVRIYVYMFTYVHMYTYIHMSMHMSRHDFWPSFAVVRRREVHVHVHHLGAQLENVPRLFFVYSPKMKLLVAP